MGFSLITILEAMILSASLSIDAFIASFAYGSNKIKIPFTSVQIINIVCSFILGLSILAGTILRQYISHGFAVMIWFVILFTLGVVKLLDSITKSIIEKYNNFSKEMKFSMFNFKFILHLYANPEDADIDLSKTISPMEAISLAFALSLDSVAVGIGAALGNVNGWVVFLTSLLADMLAIMLGCYIGNKAARKASFNISWLGGVILIILAFTKLF